MREILFRGLRVLDREGLPLQDKVWVVGSVHIDVQEHSCTINGIRVQRETVGQFTGLLDKNGKKVFEGDVVNVQARYDCIKNVPVVYQDTSFQFIIPVSNEFENKYRELRTGWYGLEVVGNVWDNAEMVAK